MLTQSFLADSLRLPHGVALAHGVGFQVAQVLEVLHVRLEGHLFHLVVLAHAHFL